ncbi:MAG: AAA family ATPase, partial [Pseudonocardia sp.]|nr:AAA family ATPase [Pseudonocardia sp.]
MGRVPRSKTALPALPKEFLRRPDLLGALDRGDNCTLTLICAPPGYGKTLLLAEWARSSEEPTAWVALDEEDDDPQRLWSAVLTSLVACPAVPASSRLRRLVVSRTTVELDFLTDLLDGLEALPERVRLVLDDVHHLRDPRTLHGLQMLVRSARTGVRLVLAGRLDPVLPVARLRMENQLCELRAEQLRFSAEESATLMERCGLRLAPGQTALLHGRTGGWVAGLRLAALSMRGHPEPDRFLAEFSGDERTVADYLVGEVLSRITEDERELLRRTSVCDPLPAALAAELSDREDAADVLDGLERDTGLVVGTGPQRDEYRIQELLRSYLTADLHRHGPGLAAQLHLRAAGWWAGRDCPVEALFHAAQAGDIAVLTDLLHHWAPELAARGEHSALRHALVAVADGPDGTDPWLALAS